MNAPVRYAHLPDPVMPRCPPQKLLLGQKALVTGASSGIGRAIAVSLGDAGADVVINYVSDEEKAQALAEEIRAKGSRAMAIRADVSDEAQVSAMFRAMVAEFGTIDILVNNAGLQQDAPFHELTLAQWNRVLGVNLTGQFLCSREAVREFRRRGVKPEVSCSAGKILCISSVHEVIPWAGHVNYAASKGGGRTGAQVVYPFLSMGTGEGRLCNLHASHRPERYSPCLRLADLRKKLDRLRRRRERSSPRHEWALRRGWKRSAAFQPSQSVTDDLCMGVACG